MVKEHHCPNCGPQPCNASTSKIHTCGVCAAVWEEVLGEGAPAARAVAPPAAPAKPVALATPAAPTPTPAGPPSAQAPPPKPGNPGAAAASIAAPPTAAPARPAPQSPAKPSETAPSAQPKPAPAVTAAKPAAPMGRRLADVLGSAQVKRCPQCRSDGLAQPSDFLEAQGRIVLIDSQSYRGHHWFADTGEAYTPSGATPTTAMPKPSGPPAAADPAT